MLPIIRYVLVDAEDVESSREYAETEYEEAKQVAGQLGHAIIARYYEYDDSELIWTPKGDDVWPPPSLRKQLRQEVKQITDREIEYGSLPLVGKAANDLRRQACYRVQDAILEAIDLLLEESC